MSGAHGMVGRALTERLRARGDVVAALVRPTSTPLEATLDVPWDPATAAIDAARLRDGAFDAVVHLAGESIMGRWTAEKRARIRESRVAGTSTLASALAPLATAPRVLVCASAVGWYGDRGEELLTEEASRGSGFLAEVVEAWEEAADEARAAGIRTVHMRCGAIYDAHDGALAKQLLPFRLGVGGPVGGGRQWATWVTLDEVVAMYEFALDDERVRGVVNAVGPTPARQREHARATARALRRPMLGRVPAFAARLAFGDVADELLLASQKVVPARLEALDFPFRDRTVDDAIGRVLSS